MAIRYRIKSMTDPTFLEEIDETYAEDVRVVGGSFVVVCPRSLGRVGTDSKAVGL